MTTLDRTPYCTKIRYGITGAPILDGDDMDGSHAPGVGISPTLIELIYSAPRDDKPASVSASSLAGGPATASATSQTSM